MTLKKDSEFKDFVDHLQAGICRTSVGTRARFEYANATLCEMLGLSSKEMTQMPIANIFFDRRKFQLFLQKMTKEGFIRGFETRLKGRGKDPFWAAISAVAVTDSKDKPKYFDMFINNVSERKLYEKELIQSKAMFQTVFNNTAAAITVTDKEERIAAWNPFTEKMLDMDKGDLFNRPVRDLYPPKEWKRMRSFQIRKKGMLEDIETKVYKKNGELLDVNVSISILKDLDGNIVGSIGIIRDITNQKLAEAKLKEEQDKIRIILDNSAASITLTDDQERIVLWNKFTEDLFGMTKKDLYMRPVQSLYPEEEWIKIRSENIRRKGSQHHLRTKVMHKSGRVLDVDLSVNILKGSDNQIIGSVGILQDITQQKKFEEMLVQSKLIAEEASSAKSLFLANMSHEVRTPMNTIMGMLDLTLDTEMTDEQRDNISVAKDAADNLLGLINDILDLSRVEAGKITLESIEFHLHNVVASVVKGLTVLAKKKNLDIAINVDSDVPLLIEGDPVRLRQILINLINNAIKFTHKGLITVNVKKAALGGDKVSVRFEVVDQGIGIPKDRQDKVFEVFTQADDSTTRQFGGTGLGLAICKRLTEMMDGEIGVISEVGKGSTFYFTANFKILKAKSAAVSTGSGVSEEEVSGSSFENLKDIHILLAEDNLVNQRIAARLLEKQGWKVTAVGDGQSVIDALNKEAFDVVLMDAQMPILDGFEATRIIRKGEESTGRHMPIIALTARVMAEDRKQCEEAGMDGYVAKPIDRKKLYEAIANQVRK